MSIKCFFCFKKRLNRRITSYNVCYTKLLRDRYSQNIKPILNYCVDFKLGKPSYDDIYRLIYKVVTTEEIKIGKSSVDKLFEEANGDIRFILNSLQLGVKRGDSNKNIQSANIFDTTGQLFSQENSIEDKIRYYWMS